MASRESNSFFDQSLAPIILQFGQEDQLKLCKFLFTAFTDTATKYFRTFNLPDSEVKRLVSKDHENFKEMLLNHLESVINENDSIDNSIDEIYTESMIDDQFMNDALIEMNLLMKDIEGRE